MKKLFFLFFVVLLIGCQGTTCFKVGGGYKDVTGNIEYCFNSSQSVSLKTPAFDEKKEDGKTETVFGFTLDEVNKIVEKLKSTVKEKIETKVKKHPVTELKELLSKGK